MRVESSVTTVSWIPSEAVTGPVLKGTFESGFTSYDEPPPDAIDDLEAWRDAGRFRFANRLSAWVEIEDGRIVDAGYAGGGMMGSTTVHLAKLRATFEPVELPDLQQAARAQRHRGPLRADHRRSHRPARTPAGQAPAVPAVPRADGVDDARAHHPRRRHAPTSRCSARASSPVTGCTTPRARSRPRSGWRTSRTGTATRSASTPRGVSTSRRPSSPRSRPRSSGRCRSRSCRAVSEPEIRTVKQGKYLVQQGDPGDSLFLLLDGVLSVIIDGEAVAELGPGVILGEVAAPRGRRALGEPPGVDRRAGRGGARRPGRPRRAARAPGAPPDPA